ncbi:MAG: L,D-transpeptidase family protein [bacterium]|nr:L,D-transpeptidase family protein [bacterium]
MRNRKNDPSLFRIIFSLIAIATLVVGIFYGARWFNRDILGGGVEANAPETLETARQLLQEKQYDQAREALEPVVSRAEDQVVLADALLALAEVEQRAGNIDAALAALQRVTEDLTESPRRLEGALQYARLLDREGRVDEAQPFYLQVRENAPAPLRAWALGGLGRHQMRQDNPWEARELLAEAVRIAEWDSPAWADALDGLGDANLALVFSVAETPESKVYTVKRGDNLTAIGIKLNTTQGLLTRANSLSADAVLNLNQRLKYTPKDFRVVIERSTCRLFLMDNNGVFKRYFVGLGKPGHETALGTYKIGDKQKDPVWYKPGGGPIPPGDPGNLLGTRWMPLEPLEEGLPGDLGIHGAPDPETVGKFSSNGCARMVMSQVEELYDLVVRSTPVEIVDVFRPAASS